MAGGSVPMPREQGDQGSPLRPALFLNYDARLDKMPGVVRSADNNSLIKNVGKILAGLEPFPDEAEVPEREKELFQYLRKMERYRQEHQVDLQWEIENRLREYDPKQGGYYYTRFHHIDLRKFDLDEESPLGPMRFTNAVYKDKNDYELCEAINIYSVKIGSSDVGFPINVYGTVIARDNIDHKCVYLFCCDRNNCQIINSEDESLVLTGPKRGLAVIDDVYIESNLKIKDHQGEVRELSKGVLSIRGITGGRLKKGNVGSTSLPTRLSRVDVLYGFVKNAVEGTVAIEVTQGNFDGTIIAHTTTTTEDCLVLYDREMYGPLTGDAKGVIQLMRPVVSVSVMDMLVIVVTTSDGSEREISFTPRVNGVEEDVVRVGDIKMRVRVTWSIMGF